MNAGEHDETSLPTAETSTATRVSTLMRDRLHITVADRTTNLIETGLIDSMSLVELFMAFEEEFGFDAADDDLNLDDFLTLDSITAFVERHLAARR